MSKNEFMEVDLQSEVADFSCKRSILQPILEAVSNSIQANGSNIYIYIYNDKEVFNDKNTKKYFSILNIKIEDDGDGFIQENIKRFCKLKKRTKEDKNKKGCKGIGRLSYLKFFDCVKYESITKEAKKISFNFNYDFDKDKIKIEDLKQNERHKTTAHFYRTKKDKEKYYTLQQIKQSILDELMVMLFFYNYTQNKEITITLQVGYKEKDNEGKDIFKAIDKQTITKNDIPQFKDDIKFEIEYGEDNNKKTQQFNLLYHIEDCKDGGFTKTSYCANEREVCEFFKSDNSFKLYQTNRKKIYLLLTSAYFDEEGKVNDARDDFRIKPKQIDLQCPINFETIDEKLKQEISKLFKDNNINNNNKIQKQIKEKQPFLAYYLINSQESNIVDNNKLIDFVYKQKEKDLRECFENFNKDQQDNKEEQQKLFNKVFSTTLAEYMALRQQKLKELGEMIENKEENEAKIHDFIFPKGQVLSDNDEYEFLNNINSNNLWLFDDRFMNYKYAFSDKKIKEIKDKINDRTKTLSGKEPDISTILDNIEGDYNGLFIELKHFSATLSENEDGISELNRYVNACDSDKLKNVEAYLITNNFTKDFEQILINGKYSDWNKIVIKNGSYYVNKTKPQYIFPIETLYNLCLSRHKLFFEILEKEVEMYSKNNNL